MSTLALIGLGSNLGDRRAILDAAVAALADAPGVEVRAVSSYHETAPVGGPPGQGPFLNAAAAVEADPSAEALHAHLRAIEDRAGRTRVVRWGERTLDLDLLLFGDEVINVPRLTVPHPRLPFRRFVLAPLAEIAPQARDPLTKRTVADLLALIERRPNYVAIHRPDIHEEPTLVGRLVEALDAQRLTMRAIVPSGLGDLVRRAAAMSRVVEDLAEGMGGAMRSAGSGWVVSDFWLDGFYHWAIPRLEPDHRSLEGFMRRFNSARSHVPAPMVVVCPPSRGPRRPSWEDHIASLDLNGTSASILRLEDRGEDDAFAEVLAACAASRPEGRIA